DSVESLGLLGRYTDLPETSRASADPVHRNHHHHHTNHGQQHQYPLNYRHQQFDLRYPQFDNHYNHYDNGYSSPASSPRPVSPGHVRSQSVAAVGTPALYNTNTIKRKPLSSSASPLAIRFSEGGHGFDSADLPRPETRFSRSIQADSPTLYEDPAAHIQPYQPDTTSPLADYYTSVESEHFIEESQGHPHGGDEGTDRARWPSRNTSINNPVAVKSGYPVLPPEYGDVTADDSLTTKPLDTRTARPPDIVEEGEDAQSESAYSTNSNDNSTMSIVAPKPTPPHLNLQKVERASLISTPPTTAIDSSRPPDTSKPLPKSPGSSNEYDANKEEVERIQRRTEQEKASIRLELTNKLQNERDKRKMLDQQIRELSEKASQMDMAQLNNVDANSRVKELEQTCEDLRRRLADERKVKDSFEDLLSALRGELQNASNERDNLRDEVVPQLRARLEGLETEAAEYANLTYESTKMQQELQSLKTENKSLRNSKQISEGPPSRSSVALSRSNSVTGGSFKLQRPPTGLSRSNTVKGGVESREALAERLKDVEAQRDALHSALRNLLERQEFQNRENEKKIRALEMERERLLSDSPVKGGYERDVSNLRHEIKILRRRAEEAMEHKWQAETGLAGLKMDLDRAEQEIASLRALLEENDITIPSSSVSRVNVGDSEPATVSAATATATATATSGSLEAAFKALQGSHQQSLARIRELEAEGTAVLSEKTQLALQRFEQSLTAAILERDAALQESSNYKGQVDQLLASEARQLEGERALADELSQSSRRIEELAAQVRQQLAANADLRQRLSDTVARGEAERKANGERITSLQSRLRHLEEQVVLAQTAAEERVARHEDQIRELKEAHNLQLRRAPPSPLSTGSRSPRKQNLLSPMASPFFPRSPRSPRHLAHKSIGDEVQVDQLRARVAELEQALAEVDSEMEDVI
ncbi:hypothetical protein SODALDRAFT_252299, partial [Sodiomyces alkalinus F11]